MNEDRVSHRSLLYAGVALLAVGVAIRAFSGQILAAYGGYVVDAAELQRTAVNIIVDSVAVISIPLGSALIAASFVVAAMYRLVEDARAEERVSETH